jgi:AmpD protein
MNGRPDGIILSAIQRSSPNQDCRPEECIIDLLVIHNISLPPGEFGGNWIDDLFMNRLDPNAHPYFAAIASRQVSSHLLIRRDGELIQYVPLHMRAWHAGESCFNEKARCNDFSIGIELEGSDDTPYTNAQYTTLTNVTNEIQSLFPSITTDRITGHSEIAPGRKTDPGPSFDWERYKSLLDN